MRTNTQRAVQAHTKAAELHEKAAEAADAVIVARVDEQGNTPATDVAMTANNNAHVAAMEAMELEDPDANPATPGYDAGDEAIGESNEAGCCHEIGDYELARARHTAAAKLHRAAAIAWEQQDPEEPVAINCDVCGADTQEVNIRTDKHDNVTCPACSGEPSLVISMRHLYKSGADANEVQGTLEELRDVWFATGAAVMLRHDPSTSDAYLVVSGMTEQLSSLAVAMAAMGPEVSCA